MRPSPGAPRSGELVALFFGTAALLSGLAASYAAGVALSIALDGDPTAVLPWTYLLAYVAYGDRSDYEPAFELGAWAGAGTATLLMVTSGALFQKIFRVSLHGRAAWARTKDIKKAGLFAEAGIFVGAYGRRHLFTAGSPHVLLSAPTGSGKGVGVVTPNLLNWPDSVVCLDMKGENWKLTAGFRAQYQACYLFNPTDPENRTHRYNPLAYVRVHDPYARVGDIQAIAALFWPAQDGAQLFWQSSARKLFTALACYLIDAEHSLTLSNIWRFGARLLSDPEKMNEVLSHQDELDEAVIDGFTDYLMLDDKTRNNVRVSMTAALELYMDPKIAAATSANDFDFRELRRKPISVYFVIPPGELLRLASLANLFMQQALQQNCVDDPSAKRQCLFLLDEFANIGKLDFVVKAISYVRSYGCRILTVLQGLHQLNDLYGRDTVQNFFEQHALRIAFRPESVEDAHLLSRELGTTSYAASSTSRRGLGAASITTSEHNRPLMLPQELKEMPNSAAIILQSGTPPIWARKVQYFKDKTLLERTQFPVPVIPSIKIALKQRASAVVEAPLSSVAETEINYGR